ncbi:ATP-dependent DNA helicase PIF1 [Cryptomeria japonica]|uniref:ATP-dependent DNA helicase PIF1 n=1 Tax=Cryptomeria japonica TaxID=3369 RepID=UPI0027DA313C|nr:ATP-dependent DNA helicase PIF1 [Cryptomeria japonica]
MKIEGLDEVACEIDDDDHTHFDKRAYKLGTVSDEQWRVLKAISQGKSVFVTGCAGTGKSYLLKFAVSVLVELHGPSSVFVTASSGIAACELKGRTLHSFAGVELGEEPATKLADNVGNSPVALKRWMSAKALIIDEISMIDGELSGKNRICSQENKRNQSSVWWVAAGCQWGLLSTPTGETQGP